MLPHELKPEQFAGYPPEARKLVTNHLGTLQQLPLAFLPGLLKELIDYDFKFPSERYAHEQELAQLSALSHDQFDDWFGAFAEIRLSPQLKALDWVKAPTQFLEQLSAHLWATQQLDAFREASNEYAERLRLAIPPQPQPLARMGIAVIGQGVITYDGLLFRKLRAHGTYFNRVKPEDGLRRLLDAVDERAKVHPIRFGHWYIDGGEEADHSPALTCVSYQALEPVRAALLRKMQAELDRPGNGPEELRTFLARLGPADLGLRPPNHGARDEVLDRFAVRLLTEGSGTQVFSTVFAQWAVREALRRAQPLTLLVRFAPRQRQKPMNELLTTIQAGATDLIGSLVDADMGAYYHWLNQQRLPGAEQSFFLAWFEGHSQAVAIGPSMPRGSESTSTADLGQLLAWMR